MKGSAFMIYDFETTRRRENMGMGKWEAAKAVLGGVPEDLVPFSVADMEFVAAPCIVQALHQAADFGTYGYCGPHDRYNAAVCSWFKTRHNWEIDPQWLIQTYGVVSAMTCALLGCTGEQDKVIYQPPAYPPFKRSIEFAGREPIANPLILKDGRYEMDFEGLEALCAQPDVTMLMLCSPHNPTGRVWTRAELKRVADICLRHGVTVFADEIQSDFIHAPHIHTPFASLSPEAAAITITGTAPSKTFNLAGLATSNIIIPNETLRKRFGAAAERYVGHFMNYFGIAATTAAYEQGGPWLDELLQVIEGNYDYCKEFLAEKFPSVKVAAMEGTYLMWLDLRALGLDQAGLEQLMCKAGLHVNQGYTFGEQGSGFVRMVLACPRRFVVAAMEHLDAAARELGLSR